MKRIFSVLIVIIIVLQLFHATVIFAADDSVSIDLATIVENGVVHRGSMEYAKFQSQNVIMIKPGYSNRQSGTTVVLDYVIPEYINASEYEYASFEYYKTDKGKTIRFRPALDGKMTNILHDGVSDEWHRVIFKISPDNKEEKRFNQFHFMPFDSQDANSISEERCYVRSVMVFKTNPITDKEIAFNEKIKEDILKENENLKGVNEDTPVFEDLDKMKKTFEIVKNPGFEDKNDISWVGTGAKITYNTGDAFEGKSFVKISERKEYYSGIQQDITEYLNKYGPGDYRVSAYIKNDPDASNTYNDYKLSIVLNGKEDSYSTFHITDIWQKIDGALRLKWDGELNDAFIMVSGVQKEDVADFYVDNVSMKKCLYNEEFVNHTAYIKGSDNGKFLPEDNITRAEAVAIISRLIADENNFSGKFTSDYSDVSKESWYYDNVAFMENSGMLKYFENEFKAEIPITRAEFVYLVKNISVLQEEKEVLFNDVENSHPLYEDIMKASKSGIIVGYNDNTFRPHDLITRAEAVTMVNRATKRFPVTASYYGTKIVNFTDVDESHWAYNQIAEASVNHCATIIDKGDKFVEAWEINEDNYDKELAQKIEDEANKKAEELKNNILNAKDNLEITGTKYYVSNNGNDENTGLSPKEAWKTIDKINSFDYKSGDAVLFERGGIWRGATILCKSGVTYAAYGKGEKPKLYGSEKNYADPSLWQKTDVPNVWTTTEKFSNVGFLQFDGKIMSQKVFSNEELNKNFNFMQEKYNGVPILLYYDGENPGNAFENIEIAPEYSIFIADNKHDIRIDNICMKYTGWHGVKFANVENISVTNCEVGWIGGTGGSPTSSKTRWGNGIEFWEKCKNIVVDHCYVYQVYDAALTNQWKGSTGDVVIEENVSYTNNLIEYATYSYEFFMNQYNSNSAIMKNITFANNICRYAGYGWGQDNRPNKDTSSDIKGWNSINRTENFVVKDNIFMGARLLNIDFSSYSRNLAKDTKSPKNKFPQYLIKLENNTYIGDANRRFITYNGFDYVSGYNSNYELIKDNVELSAKILIK